MEWVWRKIDVLIAAVFVAVAAVAASQGHAFMDQYEERLSRDLGQARTRVEELATGLRYKLMSDAVRTDLAAAAQERLARLDAAHDAIAGAFAVTRPFALIRHRDPALLAETRAGFVPRLPRGVDGALYAAVGALAGFALYEVLKLPLSILLREPRRRKFRRRP